MKIQYHSIIIVITNSLYNIINIIYIEYLRNYKNYLFTIVLKSLFCNLEYFITIQISIKISSSFQFFFSYLFVIIL